MRILFICKKNEIYGNALTYSRRSAGLYNSTRFITESLTRRGVEAKIVEVIDNNDIDREVSLFNPDKVVIEALWVVPSKFDELEALHPDVQWFCHLHSHMSFLALEGIAIEWITAYAAMGIGLIANSVESYEALRAILSSDEIVYLPNVYVNAMHAPIPSTYNKKDVIDVGCFGAVRPLKNHLLQALAAIEFADGLGLNLRFHINGTRVETGGEPVLKNLEKLFEVVPNAQLIVTPWCEPAEFIDMLHSTIDIGMQVSLTETFNVVTADYVTAGIPIVVSKEVAWASTYNMAADNSVPSILHVMNRVWRSRLLVRWNQRLLKKFSNQAQQMWFDFTIG